MPSRKQILNSLITDAKTIYDDVKASLDKRTKSTIIVKINTIDNIATAKKLIRQLKAFQNLTIKDVKNISTKKIKEVRKEDKFIIKYSNVFKTIKDEDNKNNYIKLIKQLEKKKLNIEFFNTGARYKNKDVLSLVINNKLNKQQIEKIVNGISRELRQYDNDGLIDVSVRSDKWYFKGQTTFSNRYIIPEDYDGVPDVSDEYDKTAIYISALPKSKGGTGKTNDCLYNCLHEVLKEKLTKIFKYPSDLKKF